MSNNQPKEKDFLAFFSKENISYLSLFIINVEQFVISFTLVDLSFIKNNTRKENLTHPKFLHASYSYILNLIHLVKSRKKDMKK